jgi:hypothetical protein
MVDYRGMIGNSPLDKSIEGILGEIADPKVTAKTMRIIYDVRRYLAGLSSIDKTRELQENKRFRTKIWELGRDDSMERLEAIRGDIPEVLYSHVRNFVTKSFRQAKEMNYNKEDR